MAGGEQITLRCVVWHAPEVRVPDILLRRLRDRRMATTVVSDPYAAMALSCRSAHPEEPGSDAASVLLLVRPDDLPRVGEVVLCLQLYAPEVVAWIFEGGSDEGSEVGATLRAATRDDIARWTFAEDRRLERFAPPLPSEERGTFLRLVHPDEGPESEPATPERGSTGAESGRGEQGQERPGSEKTRASPEPLSDEELEALLREEFPS